MTFRITTLSENTVQMGGLLAEWGLSILVETKQMSVLFDTGSSCSTVHNADMLGIDLKEVDFIALSHGHFDHTGGLRDVLRRTRKEIPVLAHPDIWQAKYALREGQGDRYIGIPFRRDELESLGACFNLIKDPFKVSDTITTTGEVPMITSFEEVDSTLFVKDNSNWQPDGVMDDQALIVKTGQGLVIILGCAHRGMINTIYHAQHITGISEIYAVIGGSHLAGVPEERLWQSIAALRELNVQMLGLCHCTDLPVASVLAQEFGSIFFFNKAGTIIDIP
jgi:7,8-dihydropterin-6-yl-methyl-4-(beta-D-ribofuranosyl)aminobenzene 5'-phosphate synthase